MGFSPVLRFACERFIPQGLSRLLFFPDFCRMQLPFPLFPLMFSPSMFLARVVLHMMANELIDALVSLYPWAGTLKSFPVFMMKLLN